MATGVWLSCYTDEIHSVTFPHWTWNVLPRFFRSCTFLEVETYVWISSRYFYYISVENIQALHMCLSELVPRSSRKKSANATHSRARHRHTLGARTTAHPITPDVNTANFERNTWDASLKMPFRGRVRQRHNPPISVCARKKLFPHQKARKQNISPIKKRAVYRQFVATVRYSQSKFLEICLLLFHKLGREGQIWLGKSQRTGAPQLSRGRRHTCV
jgi:hypothetical protein